MSSTSPTVTPPQDADAQLETLCRGSNLTAAQALIWLSQQRLPSLSIHQTAVLWIIPAEIDRTRFEQAFQHVIDGCDALRTVIEEKAGLPFQRVLPEVRGASDFVDLSDTANPADAARSWAASRSQKLFALDRQIFDSALLRLGTGRFAWYLNQHRIIADGWSALLIFRRVAEAYRALLDGRLETLPAMPLFADFVAAERQFAGTPKHQKAQSYWQQKLSATPPPISFAAHDSVAPATRRAHFSRTIGPARSQGLREICAGPAFAGAFQNLSLFSIFTGLLLACLFHRSGRQRFALGIPATGRASRKLEETAGLCTHMVVEHFEVSGGETLIALSGKVRSEMVEVLRQQNYVASTLPPRQLFDTVINFCHGKAGTFLGLPVATEFIDPGFQDDNQEKLAVQVRDYDATGQFVLDFDFRLDAFGEGTPQEEFIRHYFGILDAFLTDPQQPVQDLCPVAPDEIPELLLADPPSARTIEIGAPEEVGREPHRPSPEMGLPRTKTEETLLRLWREMLDVENIGIHHNFFDLGGRSLLAVRLFVRIEEELGANLPISLLLQAPTIAQLAVLIDQADASVRWPLRVLIQPGTGPALFCVHGLGGDILRFRDLHRRLSAGRPIHGLRAQGLDGRQAPHESVEAMAADYAAEIIAAQPEGGYHIIGYSFGGLVAYEIARQLTRQGRNVAFLGLIDTNRRVTRSLMLLNLLLLPLGEKVKYVHALMRTKIGHWKLGVAKPAPESHQTASGADLRLQGIDRVWRASWRALAKYQPEPYEGHITVFRAKEQLAPAVLKRISYPWSELATGGIDIEDLTCTHRNILIEPEVHHLAERLEKKLAETGAPGTGDPTGQVDEDVGSGPRVHSSAHR